MSENTTQEDRTLMSFFNAFHAIGSINNMREHDHLGAAIESVIEEALLRLQVMKLRNCDVGTAEEQFRRWQSLCEKFKDDCAGCPCNVDHNYLAECFAQWAQMPYDNKPTTTNNKQEKSK